MAGVSKAALLADDATKCIHADADVEPLASDIAPPLHVSTTFERSAPGEWVYARHSQPTRARAERVLGALEGGECALYASGLAAVQAVMLHVKPRCVMQSVGYHGVKEILRNWTEDRGLKVVPLGAEMKGVDLVMIESPRNPDCNLVDLAQIASEAHKAGALMCVDSTFATPMSVKPLALGVDVVMHSCTKFLGGHSDLLGGALIVRDKARYLRLVSERTILGNALGSLESFLLLRSLRTLPLRMERHSSSALQVAAFLEKHPKVLRVHQPALPSSPQHALFARQMRIAPPAFSFELRSRSSAERLPSKTLLFKNATSLGGAESLIEWRHQWDNSMSPLLLRVSVGLEDPSALIADLEQALASVE